MTQDIHPGDDVNSLDKANHAVFEQGMALRIQPPAPKATEYYYVHDEKGWVRQKCGQSTATAFSVSKVRETVKRALGKNDAPGSGGVKAVSMERVGEYA